MNSMDSRLDLYDKLVQQSRVPVYEGSIKAFLNNNAPFVCERKREGWFIYGEKYQVQAMAFNLSRPQANKMKRPRRFVMIDESVDDAFIKAYCVLHEQGHIRCFSRGCFCLYQPCVIIEKHAYYYALKKIIDERMPLSLLKYAIQVAIESVLYSSNFNACYANILLVQSKLWARAICLTSRGIPSDVYKDLVDCRSSLCRSHRVLDSVFLKSTSSPNSFYIPYADYLTRVEKHLDIRIGL